MKKALKALIIFPFFLGIALFIIGGVMGNTDLAVGGFSIAFGGSFAVSVIAVIITLKRGGGSNNGNTDSSPTEIEDPDELVSSRFERTDTPRTPKKTTVWRQSEPQPDPTPITRVVDSDAEKTDPHSVDKASAFTFVAGAIKARAEQVSAEESVKEQSEHTPTAVTAAEPEKSARETANDGKATSAPAVKRATVAYKGINHKK